VADILTLGIAQIALEPELRQNLAKMNIMIRQAKLKQCRAVLFPEAALTCSPDTLKIEIDLGLQALARSARENGIYVAFGYLDRASDESQLFNSIKVFDPQGEEILHYDKMWTVKKGSSPKLFEIDGVSFGAIICADRWLRGIEDVPAFCGAKVLVEFANNFADEWLPDQEWFWYRPRAVRNGVFSVFVNTAQHANYRDHAHLVDGHGHCAVFAPDGQCVASLAGEVDQLLVCDIDLDAATGEVAKERKAHPLVGSFWADDFDGLAAHDWQGLQSAEATLTFAAAQMQCYADVDGNMALMRAQMGTAAKQGADVIVFPELAVTGALDKDVEAADEESLGMALDMLCASAKMLGMCVVFGMPFFEGGQRYNGAFAIGGNGQVLTRYAQTVVDRPHLFTPGDQLQSMWFDLKGVPVAMLVGIKEALWSELAEMAALRGAQVLMHLCHDGGDPVFRRLMWANIASFGTTTITVNAASNPANGGSAIWEDYRRHKKQEAYSRAPYSARRVAEAHTGEEILYTTQTMRAQNPHMQRVTGCDPDRRGWYEMGARLIGGG
jgi:predicted amidohydrolase